MYKYLGSARNIRELLALLSKVDASATVSLKPMSDEPWSYIELWVSEAGDDVLIK